MNHTPEAMRRRNPLVAGVVAGLVIGLLAAGEMPARARQNYSPPPDLEAIHVPYDTLIDTNVRDGLVYYRALQQDRSRLNRYLAMLAAICPALFHF